MLVFSNVTKKVKDTTCLIYSIWYEIFMKCLEIMGRETLPDLKLYMKVIILVMENLNQEWSKGNDVNIKTLVVGVFKR